MARRQVVVRSSPSELASRPRDSEAPGQLLRQPGRVGQKLRRQSGQAGAAVSCGSGRAEASDLPPWRIELIGMRSSGSLRLPILHWAADCRGDDRRRRFCARRNAPQLGGPRDASSRSRSSSWGRMPARKAVHTARLIRLAARPEDIVLEPLFRVRESRPRSMSTSAECTIDDEPLAEMPLVPSKTTATFLRQNACFQPSGCAGRSERLFGAP